MGDNETKGDVPECCTRTNHVFAQGSHNAVRTRTVLEDGDSS